MQSSWQSKLFGVAQRGLPSRSIIWLPVAFKFWAPMPKARYSLVCCATACLVESFGKALASFAFAGGIFLRFLSLSLSLSLSQCVSLPRPLSPTLTLFRFKNSCFLAHERWNRHPGSLDLPDLTAFCTFCSFRDEYFVIGSGGFGIFTPVNISTGAPLCTREVYRKVPNVAQHPRCFQRHKAGVSQGRALHQTL